jgi:site-specific DNA recombinase
MEVALYVRVSTSRQQQTQTIEQQLDRLRVYVAEHPDWHLLEEHIYRDDGYSGATLDRPGLDRLRDRAAFAEFERVLITTPDRLARKYVHQVLLIDELNQVGCPVEFLERPMSDDPHDQLLLQIRGAVAEYERSLIADRMRRGRQAKMRNGQLLPWTVPPYGYILDPERPRDPSGVRLDPVKAAVVEQIFAWYTDPQEPVTLYWVAKRLSEDHFPTPTGRCRWNVATIRGILRNPAYMGTAYSGRTHPTTAHRRKSALQPVGPGKSHRPAPPEEWIAVPVPAIVSQETFEAAQARLDRNKQMARRHNTTNNYLLRGLVSCGQCRLACLGRTVHPGYDYYVCRGRTDALRAAQGERCAARYAPASALDELVWQDLCRILREPMLITHELERAQAGEWLPQALQARRRTVQEALAQLERQQARLLEAYLAEIIGRDEFERKRQALAQTQAGLAQQLRQLEVQAQKQVEVTALAVGIEAFCQRIQPTLAQLNFDQRRQLVELLIDRVIVDDGKVEIRYVIPTGPKGEETLFCHLRLDHFQVVALPVGLPSRHQGQLGPPRAQHDQPQGTFEDGLAVLVHHHGADQGERVRMHRQVTLPAHPQVGPPLQVYCVLVSLLGAEGGLRRGFGWPPGGRLFQRTPLPVPPRVSGQRGGGPHLGWPIEDPILGRASHADQVGERRDPTQELHRAVGAVSHVETQALVEGEVVVHQQGGQLRGPHHRGFLRALDAPHQQRHHPRWVARLRFLGQTADQGVGVPDGDGLVARHGIRLVDVGLVRQRRGAGPRHRHQVGSQEPERPLLGRGQIAPDQPRHVAVPDPPFLLRSRRTPGLKDVGDGVADAAILAAEQGAQAQLHHRTGLGAAAQGIQQVQQRVSACREELIQLLTELAELGEAGLGVGIVGHGVSPPGKVYSPKYATTRPTCLPR